MYRKLVTTPDEALVHLFFHCCLKDGGFSNAELKMVSDMIVSAKLNKDLDIKKEVMRYQEYYPTVKDEMNFLQFLIRIIKPVNQLALFSFCVELFLSDRNLSHTEEVLITKIAHLLHISEPESNTIQKLVMQLQDVQSRGSF